MSDVAEAKIRGAVAALLSGDRVEVSTASRSFEGRVWELGRSPFDGYLRARVVEDDGRVHYFKVDPRDATLAALVPPGTTERDREILSRRADVEMPSAEGAYGWPRDLALTADTPVTDDEMVNAVRSRYGGAVSRRTIVLILEAAITLLERRVEEAFTRVRVERDQQFDRAEFSERRVAELEEALRSALGYISADTDRVVGQAWRLCEQIHAALGDRP